MVCRAAVGSRREGCVERQGKTRASRQGGKGWLEKARGADEGAKERAERMRKRMKQRQVGSGSSEQEG